MRAAALFLTGCISIPSFNAGSSDAPIDTVDAPTGPLAARVINNAYFEGDSGTNGTFGMTQNSYSIGTDGLHAGDLALFIGSMDNGNLDIWPLPPGYLMLQQGFFVATDSQSYVVASKYITGNEPAKYEGTYMKQSSISGSSAITLIAISGANPVNPIEGSSTNHATDTAATPVVATSPGVVTTKPSSMVVFAAGADWSPPNGENTFEPPAGYTTLVTVGDRDTHWNWTSLGVATKTEPVPTTTDPITATLVAHRYMEPATPIGGGFWDVAIVVNPAPQ